MKEKDDKLYIIHISECISRVDQFTVDGKDDFMTDIKTQDATLRNLQTLGESAKQVTKELRVAHPEVNWRAIIGFRNILVHDYLGINLARVWEIIERDLPDLKPKIEAILKELEGTP